MQSKLAAAVGLYLQMPHEQMKQLTAKQILRRIEWDHYPIRKANGGPDAPWNLVPRLKEEHREKTSKIDIPAIAKSRRIEEKWSAFMSAIHKGRKPPKRIARWAKRRFR